MYGSKDLLLKVAIFFGGGGTLESLVIIDLVVLVLDELMLVFALLVVCLGQ